MKTSLHRTRNGWSYRAQYRQGEPVEGWSESRDGAKLALKVAVELAHRQAVAR